MNDRRPPIFVFGNAEVAADSLPPRLLPKLRTARPDLDFIELDPNEEWPETEEMTAIDTVVGLEEPHVFTDLESFDGAPRLTAHDLDALAQMRLLMKIGRLKRVRIVGLPPDLDESAAAAAVMEMLGQI